MERPIDRDVILGFVAEASSYLPEIRSGLSAFFEDRTRIDRIEETHRLVHTIRGASSMVGIHDLSVIGGYLEGAVEQLVEGRVPDHSETLQTFQQMVDLIDRYLEGLRTETLEAAPLMGEAAHLHALVGGTSDLPPAPEPLASTPEPSPVSDPLNDPDFTKTDFSGPLDPQESLPPAWLVDPEWPESVADVEPPPEEIPALTPPSPALVPPIAVPVTAVPAATLPADDVSPELLEVFALEAEDHLRTISLGLPEYAQNHSNKDILQQVRRSTHTLKGAAGMVGFRNITQLAHRMEDVLDRLYEDSLTPSSETLEALFQGADALEDMSKGASDPVRVSALLERFSAILGTAAPDPVAAPMTTPAVQAAPEPVESLVEEEAAPAMVAARAPTQFVRIPIERLDDLVKLVSELVIARGAVEQRLSDFQKQVNELQPSAERLRRASYKMETQYEASALGGGRLTVGPGGHGFDDLEFDRYTEFHRLSRELAETTSDIQTVSGELAHLLGDFDSYLERQARLSSSIEDRLMRMRMVPLATLASRLQRTVRSTASEVGKEVELLLEGEGTELDKSVLEQMADPLLHLLRNAVDHGIELPEVRVARGKPGSGTIRLRASHEGSQVVLRISDDGAGLDPERIRTVAVKRGLISAPEAGSLPESELFDLVFRPGFSTARQLSEISGRGVGLDVVKTHVHRLKGTIILESQPGRGATFTIRLPLTLAITRALLVKTRQQTFALPLEGIQQILRIERSELTEVGHQALVTIAGKAYPVVFLDRALGLKGPIDESITRPPVILLHTGENEIALVIDQLLGGREIVVKTLGSHLRRVPSVTGATLMGDGSVVLILDTAGLGRKTTSVRPSRPSAIPAPRRHDDITPLVVDDSPSVRRVVTNLFKGVGWSTMTAKDGLEALELLHGGGPRPDIILLDVEMPRMDGYEFLATLRGEAGFQNLPVVMVTSRAGEKHRQRAFSLGATAYMVKPYQDEAMLTLVRQLVVEARQGAVAP